MGTWDGRYHTRDGVGVVGVMGSGTVCGEGGGR